MNTLPIVEKELNKISGNLVSITRDTAKGWFVLEIGIPNTWVYNSNKDIECSVVIESEEGCLIQISPKRKGVISDDLIEFVERIIKTNEQITKKENEFKNRLESEKKRLEKDAEKFYNELENLKKTAFENVSDEEMVTEEKTTDTQGEPITKKKRGRPPKKKVG